MTIDSKSVRQGDVITKKIRVVCKKCNSGWMSRIEEAVKPILLKLINGTANIITPLEQKNVHNWIMMKAIISEHSEKDLNVTPIKDRKEFYENTTIPDYFGIYIGKNNSDSVSGFLRHTSTLSKNNNISGSFLGGLNRNTQSISFICNRLFVHVIAARVDNMDINKYFDLSSLVKLSIHSSQSIDWTSLSPISKSNIHQITWSMEAFTNKVTNIENKKTR